MKWISLSETLQRSEPGDYLISRSLRPENGMYDYRAWCGSPSELVLEIRAHDEHQDRSEAIGRCKQACLEHMGARGGDEGGEAFQSSAIARAP